MSDSSPDGTIDGLLLELLENSECQLLCTSMSGAEVVAAPRQLHEWADKEVQAIDPLEPLDADSHPRATTTFLQAIASGWGASDVRTVAGSPQRLDIFNRSSDLGCMVMTLTPGTAPRDLTVSQISAPTPRSCLARLDGAGNFLWADEKYERMLGFTPLLGVSTVDRIHPDDRERSVVAFAELIGDRGGQHLIRIRMRHGAGHWLWVELRRTNLLHIADPHILTEVFDISSEMQAQVALEARQSLLTQLTQSLPIGVVHLSAKDEIDLANDRWTELTGTTPTGDLVNIITATFDEPDRILARLIENAPNARTIEVDVTFTGSGEVGATRHGRLRFADVTTGYPATPTGGTLLTLTDITDTVDVHTELDLLARTDHLTSVLNRYGIEQQIDQLLSTLQQAPRESRNRASFQLLYFDLNDFKAVNDSFGHAAGDRLLQQTARLIRSQLRADDLVGRLGGDEFVAVLRVESASEAAAVANRIIDALRRDHQTTAAFGIATAEVGDTFDSLATRADRAMYAHKQGGEAEAPTAEPNAVIRPGRPLGSGHS